jgi:molecular chaperone DnaK (HSP70)
VGHSLGIDLGTTFVAAAVAEDRRAELVPLRDRSAVAHAPVHVGGNGSLTTGDAAARRAVSDPDQGTQALERRLGDPAPVMLGGGLSTGTVLLGTLLPTVLARAVEVSAGELDTVLLTHPAAGGPVQCRARADVAGSAGLTRQSTLSPPGEPASVGSV